MTRGRTTSTTVAINSTVNASVHTAPSNLACVELTTNASRHHAVTSSTAAQARAVTPSGVLESTWSVRMRARTGNAVIDIATPTKRANAKKGTSAVDNRGYRNTESATPSRNGRT